jgi:hypothetical protein
MKVRRQGLKSRLFTNKSFGGCVYGVASIVVATAIPVVTAAPAQAVACLPPGNCAGQNVTDPPHQFNNQTYTNGRFTKAVFEGMTLVNTVFTGADFVGADLRRVTFQNVDFNYANLIEADLRGAIFDKKTTLAGARIAGAKGLMPPWHLIVDSRGRPVDVKDDDQTEREPEPGPVVRVFVKVVPQQTPPFSRLS